ncbi:MAG: VOC family protein [Gammaproteobacteria bacterium]
MNITQLGYLGIAASNTDAWRTFAAGFLGMQVIEAGAQRLALRMDARRQRFLIEPAGRDGVAFVGFEVANRESLNEASATLTAIGVHAQRGNTTEREARHVEDFLWFRDPDGNRVELYCGPLDAEEPFTPSRPIGGFRTGELGLGHVVVKTPDFATLERFYREALGFRMSDFIAATPFKASFLQLNARHHSLAIIESPERGPASRDGRVQLSRRHRPPLRRGAAAARLVAVTLGRHSNDHMLSFYSRTPGGFMIETGWAGRLIDEHNWTPEALYGPSLWGHERSWLSPEAQAAARRQREVAGEQGIRAPTQVAATSAFAYFEASQSSAGQDTP